MSQKIPPGRIFAGHQTFHPRFGWIKKGLNACTKDREAFRRPNAPVELGVGKNMVEAIKFWTIATHVGTRVTSTRTGRAWDVVPTNIGTTLLGDDGLDPYMEDQTTLWILHWLTVSAPSLLPVWRATFNDFSALSFTEDDLLGFVEEEISSSAERPPHLSSIRKDVDCLLRMYSSKPRRGRQTVDDLLDSPFRSLELIVNSQDRRGFRFVRGDKPNLSSTAVGYACLDYMASQETGASTITITRLVLDDGSPGRLFRLGTRNVQSALEDLSMQGLGMTLASQAGVSQLTLDENPSSIARDLLFRHYHKQELDLARAQDIPIIGSDARDQVGGSVGPSEESVVSASTGGEQ